MLGAIAGDVIGGYYEWNSTKSKDFELFKNEVFTDDTVLTIAIAKSMLGEGSYKENIIYFGNKYNEVGYGSAFREWLKGDTDFEPYNSWANGSAMRVSPIAYLKTSKDILFESAKSAKVTHNHPEGVKGAQAIAIAIYLAREGKSKESIRNIITKNFGYDLTRTVDEIRPNYVFDVSCAGSVPESIICFLDSTDFEDCIRNAISLGGDADTMAAMAGGIAEAFYGGVPSHIEERVYELIPDEFKDILDRFRAKFY